MDRIIEQLLKLLKETLKGKFAAYEMGRRDLAGNSKLPMLCVYPKTMNTRRSGTGNDDAEFAIGITAIMATSMTAGIQQRDRKAETQLELVRAIEGRDENGKALDESVLGVLNKNITIDGNVLYTDSIAVAYDTDYPAKGSKTLTERATLTVVAHTRPQR